MGLTVSEFVSVEGITRLVPSVCRQMRFTEDQRPFCVQIFGANPESMAKGATMARESGADFVEINSGCPAPKVVRKNSGSGLLRDLKLFSRVIRAVVKAVSVPVSVKIRIGYYNGQYNVLETLNIAQEEGIQLFVIHGRTRQQGYRGLADWDAIAKAKSRARIPVVGNGDVLTAEDAICRLEESGVDGICIGRGVMHNPWVFGQIADLYAGKPMREPVLKDQEQLFHIYCGLLKAEFKYEGAVLGRLKQVTARMVKGLPNSARWRARLLRADSLEQFFDLLRLFYQSFAPDTHRSLQEIKNLNGRKSNEIESGQEYKS
jgi:nifR3 family TIM-barrel protein